MNKNIPEGTEQEYRSLCKEIEIHNRRYYTEDQPTITDFEYDQMMNRLLEIEATYPELVWRGGPARLVVLGRRGWGGVSPQKQPSS